MDEFAADFGLAVGGDWTADELLAQEDEARFGRFDAETAIELGRSLLERGERRGLPIAFEVYAGDRLVFRAALPGSNSENDRYLASKLTLARESEQDDHAMVLWAIRSRASAGAVAAEEGSR